MQENFPGNLLVNEFFGLFYWKLLYKFHEIMNPKLIRKDLKIESCLKRNWNKKNKNKSAAYSILCQNPKHKL